MCPLSGGNWFDGSCAAVCALHLPYVLPPSLYSVGFRSDSAILRSAKAHGRAKGDAFRRNAKSDCIGLSSSNSSHMNLGLRERLAYIK